MSVSEATSPIQTSILAERPVLTAVVVGLASLAPHFLLDRDLSVAFAALLISLIAGIYFGFAVVNGSLREQVIELSVATGFLVAAMVGLAAWPAIIVLAYLAHAGWDVAHHNRMRLSLVRIPSWYVPWCAIIDVILGIGLLVVWRLHGVI